MEREARIDDLVDGEEYFVVLLTPGHPDSFVGISSIIRWTSPAPRSPGPTDLTAPNRISVEPEEFSSPQLHTSLPDSSSESDIGPEEGIDLTSGLAPSPSARSLLRDISPDEDHDIDLASRLAPSPSARSLLRDISPEEDSDLASGRAPSRSARSLLRSEWNTSDISTTPEQEPANAEPRPVASNPRPTSFMLGSRLDALDIFKVDRERWYEARSNDDMRAVIGILSGEKILPEESRKRRRLDED